ncbi:MAG: class IV adenylate cyclase [Gemmataceae bacterium]|nr:class IV adenylate cyclase [Gemmataceae bacterium]
MLEVEVKYRLADRTAAIATLLEWGATLTQDRTDIDLYFQAPDRDLKSTDEAFRLRRIGSKNFLTYKGPKRDAETKTRAEIEVALADGTTTATDTERMLVALGYKPVTTVRKKRRVYHLARDGFELEVCFDAVGGSATSWSWKSSPPRSGTRVRRPPSSPRQPNSG